MLDLLSAFCASSVMAQDIKSQVTGAMKSVAGDTSASSGGEVAAGLKEALASGVGHAVQTLSKSNGYFGDSAVKILMPGKMQQVTEIMSKVGREEANIRTNPAARATDLLKKVFGK